MSVTLSIKSLSTESLSTESPPKVENVLLRQDAGSTEPVIRGFSSEATFNPATIMRPKAPTQSRRAVSAKRRFRLDWEAIAVILLMVVSAAVCIYRIMWAIHV